MDEGRGVARDGWGSVCVTGFFEQTLDFDPGAEIDEHGSNGWADVFLSKFDSEGNFQWARTWGGIYWDQAQGALADGSGNVYVVGYFSYWDDFDPGPPVDFDPGLGTDYHTSNGSGDAFLSKFPPDGNW
jgi:hypothetical protein